MPITTYPIDSGDLVIEFDYQPFEAATQEYQGCPESVDICSVRAGDFEMLHLCSKLAIAIFEEKCLEDIKALRG